MRLVVLRFPIFKCSLLFQIKAEETYSPPQATTKRTRPTRTTARYGQQVYDDDSDKDPSWQDDDTPSPTRHVVGYIPVSIPIDPL